jgi:GR25 family glycosyltransferase involved in LPS biosynthesis
MPFIGRYINMDASTDRRAAMEAQFERIGLADRYARFAGADGRALDGSRSRLSPGELGCFMSHYRCLVESDVEGHHIHIVEDDVVLAPQAASLLELAIGDATPTCDLLFTDIFVPLNTTVLFELMKEYRATGLLGQRLTAPETRMPAYVMYPNLAPMPFGGATSYIVNRDARAKVIALLEEEIARGPNHPIDMVYRILVNEGRLGARCTIPFLTSIEPSSICDSTIIGRTQDNDSALAFYALRSFFYLARDDDQLMGFMRGVNASLDDPDFLGPMLEFFRFVFSERFKIF